MIKLRDNIPIKLPWKSDLFESISVLGLCYSPFRQFASILSVDDSKWRFINIHRHQRKQTGIWNTHSYRSTACVTEHHVVRHLAFVNLNTSGWCMLRGGDFKMRCWLPVVLHTLCHRWSETKWKQSSARSKVYSFQPAPQSGVIEYNSYKRILYTCKCMNKQLCQSYVVVIKWLIWIKVNILQLGAGDNDFACVAQVFFSYGETKNTHDEHWKSACFGWLSNYPLPQIFSQRFMAICSTTVENILSSFSWEMSWLLQVLYSRKVTVFTGL